MNRTITDRYGKAPRLGPYRRQAIGDPSKPLHPLDPIAGYRPLLDDFRTRPDLADYYSDAVAWLRYITEVENQKISVLEVGTGGDLYLNLLEFDYPHRWRDAYRRRTLAKLYDLEKALSGTDARYTLMSLTTYQQGAYSKRQVGGYTIPEAFGVLADGGRRLMANVRQHIAPGIDYLWITEPHKGNDSGYPHRHYILNRELTQDQQDRIARLWSEQYQGGSREHGIDFTVRATGSLKSIRNYVMAYLAKSLHPSCLTPGEVVYHAVAHRHHFRFWGASRPFLALMKKPPTPRAVKWVKTQFLDQWGDPYRVKKSDEVAPEIIALALEKMNACTFT